MAPTDLGEAKGENRQGQDIAVATAKYEAAVALEIIWSFVGSWCQSDGGCSVCRLTKIYRTCPEMLTLQAMGEIICYFNKSRRY